MLLELAAAVFLEMTGPDGQEIDVNRDEIVAIRSPRRAEHFAPGTRCIVSTSDGKYFTVQETCKAVTKMLRQ